MNEPTKEHVATMNAFFPGIGDQFRVIWETQQQLRTNASNDVLLEVQEACVGLADVVLSGLCQRTFNNVKLVTHETEGSSGNEPSKERAAPRKKISRKADLLVPNPKTVRDFLKGEYKDLIPEKLNVFCSVLDPCNKSIIDCELQGVFPDYGTRWNVLLGCVHESNVEKVYELFIPEPERSTGRAIMFGQFHKNVNETLKTKKKESEKGSIRNVARDKMCVLYPDLYRVDIAARLVDAEEDEDEDLTQDNAEVSALLLGDNGEGFSFPEVQNGNISPARKNASSNLLALKRKVVRFHQAYMILIS